MKISPELFEQIRAVFFYVILAFMAFVGIRIAMIEYRRRHPDPPPRRAPSAGATGGPPTGSDTRSHTATFGTAGIGASDVAGMAMSSGDSSAEAGADGGSGFDSGGDSGGDFGGGGGDSGGGGSSGGW